MAVRRPATWANAVLVTGITVAIVVLLVDLAAVVGPTWDVSRSGATLEPETRSVLAALDEGGEPVTVTAFSAQRRDEQAWYRDRTVRDLLRDLEEGSHLLRTSFVDFDAERVTAEALGVRGHGTVVVQGRGRRVDLTERDLFPAGTSQPGEFRGETEIRRALRLVLSERARAISLLQGHGERRPEQLRRLLALLRGQGWEVRSLDLLRDAGGRPPEVSRDTDVVAIIGPTSPLTPEEGDALRRWMEGGGRMAFLVDPEGFVPEVVEDQGVNVLAGVVRDRVMLFPFRDRPILSVRRHPVTEMLVEGGQVVVLDGAAALQVGGEAVASILLETSPQGWLERGVGASSSGGTPLAVAVAVTEPGHGSRLVVVGDVDWVTDALLDEGPGNATFAVGVFRWLLGDAGPAAPVARPEALRQVAMSSGQLGAVRALLVGVLPGLVLLAGLVVWAWRRRR